MLRACVGGVEHVQGELKGNLLERAGVIEQRNRGAESFEVQKADRIFKLAEKCGERGTVYVRLASEQGGALDGLVVRESDSYGNLVQVLDALLEEGEGFRAAAAEGEHAGLWQK